jgi:hypothetical protein
MIQILENRMKLIIWDSIGLVIPPERKSAKRNFINSWLRDGWRLDDVAFSARRCGGVSGYRNVKTSNRQNNIKLYNKRRMIRLQFLKNEMRKRERYSPAELTVRCCV